MIRKFTIALLALPIIVNASGIADKKPTTITGARVSKVNDRTNSPDFIQFVSENKPSFSQFENWSKENLAMRAEDALLEEQKDQDILGYNHHRFQQTYKNMPVEWATYIVHEKNGLIESINGDYYKGVTPSNSVQVSKAAALASAKNTIGAVKYKSDMPEEEAFLKKALNKPDFSFDTKGDLVVLPVNGDFRIAYRFDIFAHEPMGRWDVYVDAQTNKVIMQISKIADVDVDAIAHTKYSGIRSIKTDSLATDTFRLKETSHGGGIQTMNLKGETVISKGVDFYDSDNDWNNFNAKEDEVATDAHWAIAKTYEYYKNVMNRKSYDNKDSKILNFVHYSKDYVNASWNGYYMVYGDGDADYTPLTALDICGHELSHGVTGNTAKLAYKSESGALNESFSDVFGNSIERVEKPTTYKWIIGEDINKGKGLRDMSNPKKFGNPDTYNGKNWTKIKGCVPTSNNDQCGVHNNSGVQNFWYYLLVDGGTGINDLDSAYSVTGIGIDKAAQIAYRNLSVYLTPNSNYADACFYSIQAAADLFGANSEEVKQTTNAWYAVGIGSKFSAVPVSYFSVERNYCSSDSTFTFINTSAGSTTFKWNFGDGTTSTLRNPTHKYTAKGNYTVTLIASGSGASDTLSQVEYVKLYTDQVAPLKCPSHAINAYAKAGVLNFTFAGINNTSEDGVKDGDPYIDNTCERGHAEAGKDVPVSISTDPTLKQYTRVWIDFNNDSIFSYPSELVFATDTITGICTGTIHIPDSAYNAGPVRVKVVAGRSLTNKPDSACVTTKFGQIEEYGLYITAAPLAVNTINSISKLSIFPNPSTGVFIINAEIRSASKMAISVIDLLGQEVYKESSTIDSGSFNRSIDLSNYPKGIYYLKINTGTQQQVQKIILQ